MANRYERIEIINDTLKLCKDNEELNKCIIKSIEGQRIFWEKDDIKLDDIDRVYNTELFISTARTLEAAEKYVKDGSSKVAVLNFASSVTPGGGVLRGTTAQEESICRISTLYPCLTDEKTAKPFYDEHIRMIHSGEMSRKNRDDCIYTPGVMVFKKDTFECEMMNENEWYSLDVITCAAPDQRHDESGREFRPDADELINVFKDRWIKIMEVAAVNKVDVLILGAFGCGAFGNPADMVAKAANIACKQFEGVFRIVEFAVYESMIKGENYKQFKDNIEHISEIDK